VPRPVSAVLCDHTLETHFICLLQIGEQFGGGFDIIRIFVGMVFQLIE
jgi:hypothetical protein